MSEQAAEATNATASAPEGDGDDGGKQWKPPASQEELDRIISDRLKRQAAQLKADEDTKRKASEYDKLVESQKTESQKATEAREAAERRATEAEMRATRLEVAHAKGLTPGQAKRLVGNTREEIEADADEILAEFTAAGTSARVDQGVRGHAAPDMSQDMNYQLRRAAGRL